MQKFSKIITAMMASLASVLPSKADALYQNTGTASWPGFVRPSTMRQWYNGRSHTSKYRPHQGVRECARRARYSAKPFVVSKHSKFA